MESPAICGLEAQALQGECPLWPVRKQVLYWVDILASVLYGFDPASGEKRSATELLAYPQSSNLLAVRIEVAGCAEPLFAGENTPRFHRLNTQPMAVQRAGYRTGTPACQSTAASWYRA